MKKVGLLLVAVVGLASLEGCGSTYYSVKDPVGGGTYYTKEVEVVRGGALVFRDGRSGATVTIQNSSVKEITEEEFNVGIYTAEPAKPVQAPVQIQVTPAAPAAVPAPAAAPGSTPAPVEAPTQTK